MKNIRSPFSCKMLYLTFHYKYDAEKMKKINEKQKIGPLYLAFDSDKDINVYESTID